MNERNVGEQIAGWPTYVDCPHCGTTHDTEGWTNGADVFCEYCHKPFCYTQSGATPVQSSDNSTAAPSSVPVECEYRKALSDIEKHFAWLLTVNRGAGAYEVGWVDAIKALGQYIESKRPATPCPCAGLREPEDWKQKIFTHKHLDPMCVENGCQSLAIDRLRELYEIANEERTRLASTLAQTALERDRLREENELRRKWIHRISCMVVFDGGIGGSPSPAGEEADLFDRVERLVQDRNSLRSQLTAAQEDRERLDWLSKQLIAISSHGTDGQPPRSWIVDFYEREEDGIDNPDLRAAIDTARQGEGR